MNKIELKRIIDAIEIIQLPISFKPSAIFDDVTGSAIAAVNL